MLGRYESDEADPELDRGGKPDLRRCAIEPWEVEAETNTVEGITVLSRSLSRSR